jgi:hypothetical protein
VLELYGGQHAETTVAALPVVDDLQVLKSVLASSTRVFQPGGGLAVPPTFVTSTPRSSIRCLPPLTTAGARWDRRDRDHVSQLCPPHRLLSLCMVVYIGMTSRITRCRQFSCSGSSQ